jgi:hypothetical protein
LGCTLPLASSASPLASSCCTAWDWKRWTELFLIATVATSAAGFPLPAEGILPSHIFGVVSLAILAAAIYARYGQRLAGHWRKVYLLGAVGAQYLNVFVLVAQAFLKVPPLQALAPTQQEPPFLMTQLLVLVGFVVLGRICVDRFRGEVLLAA